jgi:hypothetical protein
MPSLWTSPNSSVDEEELHEKLGKLKSTAVQAARAAGVRELRPRDLRRTFATRLFETGVDALLVQRILGLFGGDNPNLRLPHRPAIARRWAPLPSILSSVRGLWSRILSPDVAISVRIEGKEENDELLIYSCC